MKTIFLIVVILFSGCSWQDYHLAALTESFNSSTQNRHLAYLRRVEAEKSAIPCGYFPPGYGGFTLSCAQD